jgi:hypothetical protein
VVAVSFFLEFDGEKKMCEVQDVINRIKVSLEAHIAKSSVSVVPTSTAVCEGTIPPPPE